MGKVLALLLLLTGLAHAQEEPAAKPLSLPLYSMRGGFEVIKTDTNKLSITRGHATAGNGQLLLTSISGAIDLTQVGCGGRDHATAIDEGASYQLYIARHASDGTFCYLASRGIRLAGEDWFKFAVTYPESYLPWIKLRMAWRQRAAWDGIPDFTMLSDREVLLTGAEAAGPYRVALSLNTLGKWQNVSLANVLPDAARIANVSIQVGPVTTGSTSGTCFIRTLSTSLTGLPIGTVTSTSAVRPTWTGKIRVRSNEPGNPASLTFQVRSDGGCVFRSIVLLGYNLIEPL